MNTEETNELYNDGLEAWNDWAEALLIEKADYKKNGEWAINKRSWEDKATADFSNFGTIIELDQDHQIEADFKGFVFPGLAKFNNLIFENEANFNGARFCAAVDFTETTFKGDALFMGAKFDFDALFNKARFILNAIFDLSNFFGPVDFEEARFYQEARFNSICATSQFNLRFTKFAQVPEFVQAHFVEAPRLDHMIIKIFSAADNNRGNRRIPRLYKIVEKPDDHANLVSLRKIAANSQDHSQYLNLFAQELRARRYWQDKPFGKGFDRFYFGFIYQWLSDFGRSILRPILFWIAGVGVLLALVLTNSLSKSCAVDWAKTTDAAYFSLINSLPGIGLFTGQKREKLLLSILCEKAAPATSKVVSANFWDFVFLFHGLWQALIIFLFLLAVRNHFKIS